MKKIILLITLATSLSLWYGCKKDKEKINFNNSNIQPSKLFTQVQSKQEINNNLRWISIGIADQANSTLNFKSDLHNLLDANNFYTLNNTSIQNSFISMSNHDYEDYTYQGVNSNFTPNSYNRSLFYGFNYENCDWTVGVTSPELDDEDFTKQLVVVPAYLDQVNGFDEFIGYYYDTNTGGIDSVLIIDGDNDEDYYKWYVYTSNDCDKGTLLRRGGFGECNNDSICQPWLGERRSNCADCNTKPVPQNYSSLKDLLLHSVTFNSDWKKDGNNWPGNKYQETYIGGNYEVIFNYLVFDTVKNEVKDSFLIDDYFFSLGKSEYDINGQRMGSSFEYPFLDILSARGKTPEIKRCKKRKRGGSKCNKGSSPRTFIYDSPMTDVFDSQTDKIVFNIAELDRTSSANISAATAKITPTRIVSTITATKFGKPWTSAQSPIPGLINLTKTSGPVFHDFTMFTIHPLANWVSGPPINGKNAMYLSVVNPDDGEMTYTFVMVDK